MASTNSIYRPIRTQTSINSSVPAQLFPVSGLLVIFIVIRTVYHQPGWLLQKQFSQQYLNLITTPAEVNVLRRLYIQLYSPKW